MTASPALLRQIDHITAQALRSGALLPIPTVARVLRDGGVDFVVRVVDNLRRKDEAGRRAATAGGAAANPFLPYERALWVADLAPHHVLLLNKFNVMERHALLVTRQFEEQESALNAADFTALWRCLAQIDGLAFYNAGVLAGASQRHKHLQLVPLPLVPEQAGAPVEALFGSGPGEDVSRLSGLPFAHAAVALDPAWVAVPERAGAETALRYRTLLAAVGRGGDHGYGGYNLLLSRRWMLAVPRTQESCEGMSINALGFAGALLVRSPEQLERLRTIGPMAVLRAVTG